MVGRLVHTMLEIIKNVLLLLTRANILLVASSTLFIARYTIEPQSRDPVGHTDFTITDWIRGKMGILSVDLSSS